MIYIYIINYRIHIQVYSVSHLLSPRRTTIRSKVRYTMYNIYTSNTYIFNPQHNIFQKKKKKKQRAAEEETPDPPTKKRKQHNN